LSNQQRSRSNSLTPEWLLFFFMDFTPFLFSVWVADQTST
jgi:hypothetical protein